MYNPKVSIIVPIYNVESFLSKCLDSIVYQKFTDWECVLVDDGSTDMSGRICDEYAAKDRRFIVIHKQNEGVAKARISAFNRSNGEYITFIDADDYASPQFLEYLCSALIENNADMVSCNFYNVVNGVPNIKRPCLMGTYRDEEIKKFVMEHYFWDNKVNGYGMTCYLWTKMIKREYVLKGLEEGDGMWFAEDQVTFLTVMQNIKTLCLIGDPLYYYVQHSNHVTSRYNKSLWDNIIKLVLKYKEFNTDGKETDGLRHRIWRHISNSTDKMLNANIKRTVFINDLSYMRCNPVFANFFNPIILRVGFISQIEYLLLKLRLYNTFFYLVKFRRILSHVINRVFNGK